MRERRKSFLMNCHPSNDANMFHSNRRSRSSVQKCIQMFREAFAISVRLVSSHAIRIHVNDRAIGRMVDAGFRN